MNEDSKDLRWIIGNTLRIGVWSAFVITLIGMVVFLIQKGNINMAILTSPTHNFNFQNWLGGLFRGEGECIILGGIIMLILTPFIRVVFALWGYYKEKNTLYIIITFIVLLAIALSLWIGMYY